MWNNIRSGLAVLVATLLIGVGIVQSGTGTVTIKDASGTTQTYAIVTDGSGHFIAEHVICDYSAGANCAAVNSSHQLTTLEANSAAILSAIQSSIPAGSAIIGKVGIDQTTPGTTNLVQTPTTTNGGAATVKGGVAVVNGGSFYQAVAASQTATVLQSATGATGDYLSHCVIYPASTSPGVVTVFDNTNTAANSAILFPGGASSTSNLVPFSVPVGAVSVNGAWKVTTGANVSVVCYGKFSFLWDSLKTSFGIG